jgi:predicted RNA-binding Zn ribbon-like protein
MDKKKPRYDLPNAAPEPLRFVQRFVNTIDLSHDREWLEAWLEEQGLTSPTGSELAHARTLREAIRELLYANNGHGEPGGGTQALSAAADAASLTIDFTRGELVPQAPGLDGILGRVAVVCLETMGDGTWHRLKCCRNVNCRWSFYDYSKNRSATWCSMQLCGNRTKTRAYRRRVDRRAV